MSADPAPAAEPPLPDAAAVPAATVAPGTCVLNDSSRMSPATVLLSARMARRMQVCSVQTFGALRPLRY